MPYLQVTNTFVKKLTKNIRNQYGKESSHTEVMALIADALGWQTGPLMHALKAEPSEHGASTSPLVQSGVANGLLNFNFEDEDPIAQMIRDAVEMHKLRSISYDDVARLMNLVMKPGLLLVVSNQNAEAKRHALSVAKGWAYRIGDNITYRPLVSDDQPLPFSRELGMPTTPFTHVARTADDCGERDRFSLLGVVGSPLNVGLALKTSRQMPTIATMDKAGLRLLAGYGAASHSCWSGHAHARQARLASMYSLDVSILDVETVGGRFYRTKLSTWRDWLTEQDAVPA